jgi:glucosamine kinase
VNKYTIIADSGSTKTDWVIVNEEMEVDEKVKTMGFNPYFHTSEFIYKEIATSFSAAEIDSNEVDTVHFYGAGCSSEDKNKIVYEALKQQFPSAAIHIDHDLIAASRATLGDQDGIACILGTGSNSCLWKDGEVVDNLPSHGYIFGDEGSGSHLGINLIKLYLKDGLGKELTEEFEAQFNLNKAQIINKTYREKGANVFLASFAMFYHNRVGQHSILREVMSQEFRAFFKERITCYQNYRQCDLGFVGSIAYYNQDILKEVADSFGCSIASIKQCPIDALVEYHVKQLVK